MRPESYYAATCCRATYTLTAGPLLPGYSNVKQRGGGKCHRRAERPRRICSCRRCRRWWKAACWWMTQQRMAMAFQSLARATVVVEGLRNAGGAPSTNISASLSSLTAGVTIESAARVLCQYRPGQRHNQCRTLPVLCRLGSGMRR